MGASIRFPYYLSLLAEVYGKAGQPERGVTTIDEALSMAAAHGEHWWEAELHRLRGELLWSQGADLLQVEDAFQRALDIARQQKTLALELRAAVGLARLWHASRRDEAYQLLSAVYAQFTEGFNTVDLQEAKSLLGDLA
jgi:predicted ATPase